MPDQEVVQPTTGVEGGTQTAPAQSEAQPPAQELIDLTSIGFNTKLPKAVMEKIAAYDPETIDYLGKADLKDRIAYETSFENWNKGQAHKVEEFHQKGKELEKKQKEADAIVRQHNAKLQELDKVWGDRLWETELPADTKTSLANLKQLRDDGTLTEDQYQATVKPIVETVKSAMVARKDAQDKQVKDLLDTIDNTADVMAPKYGFTNKILAHFIKGLCAEMDITPDGARELIESEIDRVINLRLIRSPKQETISPDTKTPPATPAKIESPHAGPSRDDKALFMGGIFRPRSKTG